MPARRTHRTENEDKLIIYDDETLKYMESWYSGQGDPLYAIISSGGVAPRSYFEHALSNVKRDLARVKKLPATKGDGGKRYQFGLGKFTKAEIGELQEIEAQLYDALQNPDAIYHPDRVRGRIAPRHGRAEGAHLSRTAYRTQLGTPDPGNDSATLSRAAYRGRVKRLLKGLYTARSAPTILPLIDDGYAMGRGSLHTSRMIAGSYGWKGR